MTTTDTGWEHIGRAAERFARRVARDTGKFAERLQEHAGDLGRDVASEWRCGHRLHRRDRQAAQADVRGIFEDIRVVLSDLIDGVDELIARVFPDQPGGRDAQWLRVVANRDATCGGCARTIGTGDEAYLRRERGAPEFRCLTCGVPAAGDDATS